jgi:hypothetical protein
MNRGKVYFDEINTNKIRKKEYYIISQKCLQFTVPDLHFDTDPDPWIRTLDYGSGL